MLVVYESIFRWYMGVSETGVYPTNVNSNWKMIAILFRDMVSAGIIERKLRRTKVRLFTVPCCSITEGMKKNVSDLPPIFFFVVL